MQNIVIIYGFIMLFVIYSYLGSNGTLQEALLMQLSNTTAFKERKLF